LTKSEQSDISVVHGGEKFAKSVVVTPEVKAAIAECNDLAPLHNPANLIGIEACESLNAGHTTGCCI